MKKVFCVILALLFTFTLSAIAESIFTVPEMKMIVNGTRLVLIDEKNNVLPNISSDGTLYVPVKEFVESLGGTYDYDVETSTINISMNSMAETKASTKQIELTKDNFTEYFTITVDRSDYDCKYSNVNTYGLSGFSTYYYSEKLTLHVNANAPFEMHNVQFTVSQKLNFRNTNGTNPENNTITFTGMVPQSGSYESSQTIEWNVPALTERTMTLDTLSVSNVKGYIIIEE